jgi:DNA-3-methyladenine glycosylase II
VVSGLLCTDAPFHLEATVRVLQRRPNNRVDVWEDNRYLRVLETTGDLVLVQVQNHGTVEAPRVEYSLRTGSLASLSRYQIEQVLRRLLGLNVDPLPLQQLVEGKRKLRATALALRGMRPPRFTSLFEAFANVVPFQQVSLDAGVAVVGRMVERFGRSLQHEGRRFHEFPQAHVIADTHVDMLKACGMTARKADTIRRVARAVESGQVTEEKLCSMDSEEAIRFLTELQGIGAWSASVILLRGMGRLDVFPPADVGAIRGLSKLMHLEVGSSLERAIRGFRDYRGYLYFFALGSDLLARGLIHAAHSMEKEADV